MPRIKLIVLLGAVLLFSLTKAYSQENDWPCAQILVPAVSAAILWPNPIDETFSHEQLSNRELINFALQIAKRFKLGEEDVSLIKARLEAVDASERSKTATAMFVVMLKAFNDKRKKYLQGIQKATSKQKELANRLVFLLDHRDQLLSKGLPEDELVEEIPTVEQIFRSRENILNSLCEQPVRVEENLGIVARVMAEFLD